MKKMRTPNGKLNIIEWFMTVNNWEYYITDQKHDDDIVLAYVCGLEDEMGDVSLSELKPYIIARTTNLNEIQPAPKCSWVD